MSLPYNFITVQNKRIRSQTDLIITSGQTVNLGPGTYYYNKVRIDAGGTLSIFSAGGLAKTEIGVRNDFVLNGAIVCQCHLPGGSANISGTYDLIPTTYNFTISQASGGSGGTSGGYEPNWFGGTPAFPGNGRAGGSGANGFGGGGGGGGGLTYPGGVGGSGGGNGQAGSIGGQYYNPGNAGSFAYPGGGGNAGYPQGGGGTGAGGYGAMQGGNGGGSGGGSGGWGPDQNSASGGGGGGGGGKGYHGGVLMLYLERGISGTGTIYLNGTNGFGGGTSGGRSYAHGIGSPGGGGGGGAGGSGGHLVIYKKPGVTVTFNYTMSAGGAGGGGPTADGSTSAYSGGGLNGNSGSNGFAGSVALNTIIRS